MHQTLQQGMHAATQGNKGDVTQLSSTCYTTDLIDTTKAT